MTDDPYRGKQPQTEPEGEVYRTVTGRVLTGHQIEKLGQGSTVVDGNEPLTNAEIVDLRRQGAIP